MGNQLKVCLEPYTKAGKEKLQKETIKECEQHIDELTKSIGDAIVKIESINNTITNYTETEQARFKLKRNGASKDDKLVFDRTVSVFEDEKAMINRKINEERLLLQERREELNLMKTLNRNKQQEMNRKKMIKHGFIDIKKKNDKQKEHEQQLQTITNVANANAQSLEDAIEITKELTVNQRIETKKLENHFKHANNNNNINSYSYKEEEKHPLDQEMLVEIELKEVPLISKLKQSTPLTPLKQQQQQNHNTNNNKKKQIQIT